MEATPATFLSHSSCLWIFTGIIKLMNDRAHWQICLSRLVTPVGDTQRAPLERWGIVLQIFLVFLKYQFWGWSNTAFMVPLIWRQRGMQQTDKDLKDQKSVSNWRCIVMKGKLVRKIETISENEFQFHIYRDRENAPKVTGITWIDECAM